MQVPIEYDLDTLVEILKKFQQQYGNNLKVQIFDYRLEQFMPIDGIEFEEHSQTILIT